MKAIIPLLLVFVALLSSCNEEEPIVDEFGSVIGYVYDSKSKKALEFVNVTINGKTLRTNYLGRFEFTKVLVGTFDVKFSISGYKEKTQPIVVTKDKTTELESYLEADAPYFSISKNKLKIDSTYQTVDISVKSNYNWIVEDYSSWISCNPMSGIGAKTAHIRCEENKSNKTRTDSIVFKCDNMIEVLIVEQEG